MRRRITIVGKVPASILQTFINKQPDDRPINWHQPYEKSGCGCLFVQFANETTLLDPSYKFQSAGLEHLFFGRREEIFSLKMPQLYWKYRYLIDGQQVNNYGQLKQRMKEMK